MTFDLRNLSKTYQGYPVLSDISLMLGPGESVAVLGRSGAGKSTLLRMLAGLDPPTAGEVLVDGVLASKPGAIRLPAHRRGVSMVFQDLALWPNLTVLGNVLLALSSSPLKGPERRARAREVLALCAIDRLENRTPSQISGGEQQRVALARAVAPRPKFLLLDEPFSGLDPVTKAQIVDEILRLARTQGIAVVLVTHEPFDALALCRSGIVLEEGRIAEAGPLVDLLRAPQSTLLKVFKERLETVRQGARPEGSPM